MAKVKKMAFGGMGSAVKNVGAAVKNIAAAQKAAASRPLIAAAAQKAAASRPLTAGPQLKFMSDTLRGGMPAKPVGIGAQLAARPGATTGPARGIARNDLKMAGFMKKGGVATSKRASKTTKKLGK